MKIVLLNLVLAFVLAMTQYFVTGIPGRVAIIPIYLMIVIAHSLYIINQERKNESPN